ncbi:MAG: metallophosphoesterase family protein [Paludibacteraceae bacterium]|nr:metallophosphoesterase family protein [Paludibacteraceae bacterium]
MVRIGLLSDTHGYWDERYAEFFAPCDEIWHAGDIGDITLYNQLLNCKPVRAVVGNIDGYPLRNMLPTIHTFEIENIRVLMTHIGGYPGKYAPGIIQKLRTEHTTLFISGHSHILKVMYDPTLGLLHINPGAAGRQGFHKVRTLIRFVIDGEKIKDLEIKEIPLNEAN